MSSTFMGVAFGGNNVDKSNVLVQTGTTGRALELSFDQTSSFNNAAGGRDDVLQALDTIKAQILAGTWPPV